jgi:hypothetical protein
MSMHEFEYLVEASIVTLAERRPPGLDLRSAFWNLYQFQDKFDCGFTHFRVMDELLAHRFVYRFPLGAHPRHGEPAVRALLDGAGDDIKFVSVDPLAPWSPTNPTAGCYRADGLYFDAGSPLWRDFVARGLLSGADAAPPQVLPMSLLMAEVLEGALAHQDGDLLSAWFMLGPMAFDDHDDEDTLRALRADRQMARVRAVFRSAGLSNPSLAEDDGSGDIHSGFPPGPLIQWWFDLAQG